MPYKDPEKRRQAKRESARRRRQEQTGTRTVPAVRAVPPLPPAAATPDRAGSTGSTGSTPDVDPVELGGAADVLALLADELARVRADDRAGTLSRARVVGYLSGCAMRALDAANLEERLVRLEEAHREVETELDDLRRPSYGRLA